MPRAELWTHEQVKALIEMREQKHMKWREIALVFDRSLANVARKYDQVMHPQIPALRAFALNIVPPECDEDRRHRSGLYPRDLTAAFMGDPLPGYSALERRA